MSKLIINKNSLPIINSSSQEYFIRYRLISEDRNKFSYWSPIFSLELEPYGTVTGTVTSSNGIISIDWQPLQNIESYDIWLNWKHGSTEIGWQYQGRYINNNITIIKPDHSPPYDAISVRVYVKTDPIPIAADLSTMSNYLIYENLAVAI